MMRRLAYLLVLGGCVPAGGGGSTEPDLALPAPDARRGILADVAPPPVDGAAPDSGPAPDATRDAEPNSDGGPPPDGAPPDAPAPPPLPECGDGADNDGDGRVDLHDSDCSSVADPRESGDASTPCSNGQDDDGDGHVDFPDDPGCVAAGDPDEADPQRVAACANGVDDDGDGLADYPIDPGCAGRGDPDESDPPVLPDCGNGEDDDGDGAIDYPADTGCDAAGDDREIGGCGPDVEVVDLNAHLVRDPHYDGTTVGAPAAFVGSCGGGAGGERVFAYRVSRGVERLIISTLHEETRSPTVVYVRRRCDAAMDLACDRGVGEASGVQVVLPRPQPGVYHLFIDTGARDGGGPFRLTVEAIPVPQCRNGVDDDADGRVDNADPGCQEADDIDERDPEEAPVCANGIDDDGDGSTDHPDDADCEFAGGGREAPLCPPGTPVVRVGQAGGDFELPPGEGAGGASPSCDPRVGAEAVLAIQLDEASDVSVEVLHDGQAASVPVHARAVCTDPETELACWGRGQMGPLRIEARPRGTLYVFVEQDFAPVGVQRVARVAIDSIVGECNDEVDNDGDGRVDLADPGCVGLRDDSERDPPAPPECDDGVDNDEDGEIDYPDDDGCEAAGDAHEGGCDGDPLWRPVECRTGEWVWSSDRGVAQDLMTANAQRVLRTGCRHANDDNDDGLCSLDGTGWVSVDSWPMAGCGERWYHIGGRHTGNCGGHDGDTVRHLVLFEDDCYDYRAER